VTDEILALLPLWARDCSKRILSLTTISVGVIDKAFSSRIHLQLDLDELDEEGQDKIREMAFWGLETAASSLSTPGEL